MPLQRYVATVTLKPVTDGNRTFWHWESTFATPPGRERELRDMVAQGVYEAGFENLRRHLRPGGDLRAPAAAPRCRPALPLPSRRVVVRALRRPRAAAARGRRGAARRAPARCASASAPSASTSSTSTCAAAGCPALLPLPGVPGMEAAGTRGRRRRRRQRPAARRPRRLPRPAARRLLQRAHRAGATGSCACRRRSRTRPPPRCCSRASPPTTCCATSAACGPARGCWCTRRPAASACCVCAWARRLGATVIGTVSSEDKARVAREHGCEHVIVDARLPLRRRGAARLRRRRRGRRRPRRRGARREPRRAGAPRPLDQPRPGQRRRCSRSRPTALVAEVADLLAPGGVRLRRRRRAQLAERAAARLGRRWPTARCRRRRSSATRSTPPRRRTRGSNRARTHRRAGAGRLKPRRSAT